MPNRASAKRKLAAFGEQTGMRNGSTSSALTFRRMGSDDRREVFALFLELMLRDDYWLDSQGAYSGRQPARDAIEATLGEALTLFVDRPDYGFIFMALEDGRPVACAAVSYAISLSLGKVVAQVEHLVVTEARRRNGIGSALIDALANQLRTIEISRLDVDVHGANEAAKRFYLDLGFKSSHEERLALLL